MKTKIFNFIAIVLLLTSLVFTSCGGNDEEETNSFSFQTEADKALERSLINTKWILSERIRYDSNDQIIDKREPGEIYFLSSERLESPELVLLYKSVDGNKNLDLKLVYRRVPTFDNK